MRSSPSRRAADSRRTATAQVVVGGLVAALSLLAAGCQGSDQGSKPSQDSSSSRPATTEPEPSPTPSQYDPVTAAKAAHTNYIDVQNAVAQDYFRGWNTKVIPLLTGIMADNRLKISEKFGDGQYYQVGEDKILSRTVTKSSENEVVMDVCISDSSVHVIGPDEKSAFDGSPEPWLTVVTVVRVEVAGDDQGNVFDGPDPFGQEWWRVSSSIQQEGVTCSG